MSNNIIITLGQDASNMSSCAGNKDVLGTAADSTLAAAIPLEQGGTANAAGGTVSMDAGSTLEAALLTLATAPLTQECTVPKASILSIMPVNTASKTGVKKHKRKDVAGELEDSFLTYM